MFRETPLTISSTPKVQVTESPLRVVSIPKEHYRQKYPHMLYEPDTRDDAEDIEDIVGHRDVEEEDTVDEEDIQDTTVSSKTTSFTTQQNKQILHGEVAHLSREELKYEQ